MDLFNLSRRWIASSTMSNDEFCWTESIVMNPSFALILKTSVIRVLRVCVFVDCTESRKLLRSFNCWITADVSFLYSSKSDFSWFNSAWRSDIFWWSFECVWLQQRETQSITTITSSRAMFRSTFFQPLVLALSEKILSWVFLSLNMKTYFCQNLMNFSFIFLLIHAYDLPENIKVLALLL